MTLPTKTQLEKISQRRLMIIGLVLVAKEGNESNPDADALIGRIHEAADDGLAEVGAELTWDDVRRLVLSTLKVCVEYLERKEPQ